MPKARPFTSLTGSNKIYKPEKGGKFVVKKLGIPLHLNGSIKMG